MSAQPAAPSHASGSDSSASPPQNQSPHGHSNGSAGSPSGPGQVMSGALGGTVPAAAAGPSQTADKSCARCRERKVRCDRQYPICKRCSKRREGDLCFWPDIVNVEDVPEPPEDDGRLDRLTAKLAQLEAELAALRSSPPVQSQAQSKASIQTLVYDAVFKDAGPEDEGAFVAYLREKLEAPTQGFFTSVDQSLGSKTMAQDLTRHLVQSGLAASCSRLPAFSLIVERVKPLLTADLPSLLSPDCEICVAVLCALGVRSSPHSALLGIALPRNPEELARVGQRRETACRLVGDIAWDRCWNRASAWQDAPSAETNLAALEALVGLTQILIFETHRAMRGRWLLRMAVGMFEDVRFLKTTERSTVALLGPVLFDADANIASATRRPSVLSMEQLSGFFPSQSPSKPTPFHLSNAKPSLDILIERLTTASPDISETTLVEALEQVLGWVCAANRRFAMFVATPSENVTHNSVTVMSEIWETIDVIHGSIQRLQQVLVALPGDIDDYTLLGIRTDTNLLELCFHIEEWLVSNGLNTKESEMRVHNCLKIFAFYSQVLMQSHDRHLLYHVVVQMDSLPTWTTIALDRSVGPLYSLTLSELDNLIRATELATFYTPRALPRLRELEAGRQAWVSSSAVKQPYFVPPPIGSTSTSTSGSKSTSTSSGFGLGSRSASANGRDNSWPSSTRSSSSTAPSQPYLSQDPTSFYTLHSPSPPSDLDPPTSVFESYFFDTLGGIEDPSGQDRSPVMTLREQGRDQRLDQAWEEAMTGGGDAMAMDGDREERDY